jgi:hypothetical protein
MNLNFLRIRTHGLRHNASTGGGEGGRVEKKEEPRTSRHATPVAVVNKQCGIYNSILYLKNIS